MHADLTNANPSANSRTGYAYFCDAEMFYVMPRCCTTQQITAASQCIWSLIKVDTVNCKWEPSSLLWLKETDILKVKFAIFSHRTLACKLKTGSAQILSLSRK